MVTPSISGSSGSRASPKACNARRCFSSASSSGQVPGGGNIQSSLCRFFAAEFMVTGFVWLSEQMDFFRIENDVGFCAFGGVSVRPTVQGQNFTLVVMYFTTRFICLFNNLLSFFSQVDYFLRRFEYRFCRFGNLSLPRQPGEGLSASGFFVVHQVEPVIDLPLARSHGNFNMFDLASVFCLQGFFVLIQYIAVGALPAPYIQRKFAYPGKSFVRSFPVGRYSRVRRLFLYRLS